MGADEAGAAGDESAHAVDSRIFSSNRPSEPQTRTPRDPQEKRPDGYRPDRPDNRGEGRQLKLVADESAAPRGGSERDQQPGEYEAGSSGPARAITRQQHGEPGQHPEREQPPPVTQR